MGFGISDGERCFAIKSLSDPTVGDTWHSGCLGEQGGCQGATAEVVLLLYL